MDERDHAAIVVSFYRQLSSYGEQGRRTFIKAAQRYGEERGKRMSLRALRDGRTLTFCDYFAYGEWRSTPDAYDMAMLPRDGAVVETVTRCPWAQVFSQQDCLECGIVYCHEIDAAVVRGFNPELNFTLKSNMHTQECCLFQYQADDITPAIFEEGREILKAVGGATILPLSYHCAHVYFVFRDVIECVFPGEIGVRIVSDASEKIRGLLGEEKYSELQTYAQTDFLRI